MKGRYKNSVFETFRYWITIDDEYFNNLFNRIGSRGVNFVWQSYSSDSVHGFWALILLRNQISNRNHVTGRTDPQPAEPISRYFVFLFRLTSLLCLFIYLSIYPYLSSTFCDHYCPFERVWNACTRTSVATPPLRLFRDGGGNGGGGNGGGGRVSSIRTRTQPHSHRSTSGFSRLINDFGDLVCLGTFSFALKWSTLLLFHRARVLPKGIPTSSPLPSPSTNVRGSDGICACLADVHVESPIVSESVSWS